MRDIGPLKERELRNYQQRHGAVIDGKLGNQTMGVILTVEESNKDLTEKMTKLWNRYELMKQLYFEEREKTWFMKLWDKLNLRSPR